MTEKYESFYGLATVEIAVLEEIIKKKGEVEEKLVEEIRQVKQILAVPR